eukprot:365687-Chlamydomonas_euryale.AAC.2
MLRRQVVHSAACADNSLHGAHMGISPRRRLCPETPGHSPHACLKFCVQCRRRAARRIRVEEEGGLCGRARMLEMREKRRGK